MFCISLLFSAAKDKKKGLHLQAAKYPPPQKKKKKKKSSSDGGGGQLWGKGSDWGRSHSPRHPHPLNIAKNIELLNFDYAYCKKWFAFCYPGLSP